MYKVITGASVRLCIEWHRIGVSVSHCHTETKLPPLGTVQFCIMHISLLMEPGVLLMTVHLFPQSVTQAEGKPSSCLSYTVDFFIMYNVRTTPRLCITTTYVEQSCVTLVTECDLPQECGTQERHKTYH